MAYGAALRTVTLSLDTSAYADGDLWFDTQEIAQAVRQKGGRAVLNSVTVLDKDDVGQTFDLVFLNAATSLGTENAAPSISDTNAEAILAVGGASNSLRIATGDFIDLGGCKMCTVSGIGLVLEASDTRSLYVAGVIRGAGTFTASGVKITFGFLWD